MTGAADTPGVGETDGGRRARLRGGPAAVVAAACATCCAGPVLALLGIGLTGAAATAFTAAFAGLVYGVVVAAAGVAAVLVRRRRARRTACSPGQAAGPVLVELGPPPGPR